MKEYYVIYKTYYLFNLVGDYTARILVPGVLLQQALFADLECAVQFLFIPISTYCIYLRRHYSSAHLIHIIHSMEGGSL